MNCQPTSGERTDGLHVEADLARGGRWARWSETRPVRQPLLQPREQARPREGAAVHQLLDHEPARERLGLGREAAQARPAPSGVAPPPSSRRVTSSWRAEVRPGSRARTRNACRTVSRPTGHRPPPRTRGWAAARCGRAGARGWPASRQRSQAGRGPGQRLGGRTGIGRAQGAPGIDHLRGRTPSGPSSTAAASGPAQPRRPHHDLLEPGAAQPLPRIDQRLGGLTRHLRGRRHHRAPSACGPARASRRGRASASRSPRPS